MNQLTVIENGLIPVYETNQNEKVANARELHEFLQSKRQFSDWIRDRITKYGFNENEDFLTISQNCENGGRRIEYILKLDVAKEIAMVENNERGREVRKYFIDVEKKSKAPKSVEDLIILQAQSVKELKSKVLELESKNEEVLSKTDVIEKRLNNFMEVDLTKPKKDILNDYVRKYSISKCKSDFSKAWKEFADAFFIVTRMNVTLRAKNAGMTRPQWLEANDLLDTAIRVIDNMLNK